MAGETCFIGTLFFNLLIQKRYTKARHTAKSACGFTFVNSGYTKVRSQMFEHGQMGAYLVVALEGCCANLDDKHNLNYFQLRGNNYAYETGKTQVFTKAAAARSGF
ncbi:hypothetical protein [Chlorogloeopsis sp. ULAP02]|uniref:hypothetical protein n=1 Tax=Chlorogloeopsis sp. ULAP02 TaxID=3107926 RepID=UPI0031349B7D